MTSFTFYSTHVFLKVDSHGTGRSTLGDFSPWPLSGYQLLQAGSCSLPERLVTICRTPWEEGGTEISLRC